MKELKPYLRRSLTTSCPLKFFTNKHAGNTDKSPSEQQISNFQPRIVQNDETRRQRRIDFQTTSSLAVSLFERFSQQSTSTFLHPYFAMRKLKYSMQDQQKQFSEFQQVAAVETCDKFRYKSFLKPCLYST